MRGWRRVMPAVGFGLLTAIACGAMAQRAGQDLTPAEVTAKFLRAIETGDAAAAESLMTGFDRLPPEAAQEIRDELRERAAAKDNDRTAQVVAHLQLDRIAVVVFDDSRPGALRIDLDPAYLVRRGDEWRLLPEITEFDSPAYGFDAPTLDSFHALESWFKEQKPRLAELRSKRQG